MAFDKYDNISRFLNTYDENADAVNFRIEFQQLLNDIGSPHVLRIVDRTKRCKCISLRDDRHNEPDPNCKICDQLGFLYNDREVLSFKSYEDGPEILGSPQKFRSDAIYFFVAHDSLKAREQSELSRIMEIYLDADGNKTDIYGNPSNRNYIMHKYNIVDAVPYREKGLIIYWRLETKRKDV